MLVTLFSQGLCKATNNLDPMFSPLCPLSVKREIPVEAGHVTTCDVNLTFPSVEGQQIILSNSADIKETRLL